MNERSTGVISLQAANDVIDGDDPYAVSLMITFLYENGYRAQLTQDTSLRVEHGKDGDTEVADEAHILNSTDKDTLDHSDQKSMWASKASKSKKGKKSAVLRTKDSSGEEIPPPPYVTFATSFLTVHARGFALGSKYDIPHLQRTSLAKFKAAACLWSKDDLLWSKDELIESIPIAFTTAPDNNGLRIAIKAIITANSALLIDDPTFQDAINGIEGLAFELFRQQTHHRGGQRTCLGCSSVYKGRCAAQGCSSHWGSEMPTCDKDDVCMNCRNNA